MTHSIKVRRVVHFAGFEPLDVEAHRSRFDHAIGVSSKTYGFEAQVGKLELDQENASFRVEAYGPNWKTITEFKVLEHSALIAGKFKRPVWQNILSGFYAAALTVIYGGLYKYLKTSWRFALFFMFPFLVVSGLLLIMGVLVVLPLLSGAGIEWVLASLPVGIAVFHFAFQGLNKRFHLNLLFSNWQIAIDMATGNNAELNKILGRFRGSLIETLSLPAYEYVVSSHSMGGAMLIHSVGTVLQSNPELFAGKRIVICTMGGAGLQCSLLSPATFLRACGLLILQAPHVVWLDVQCMTDVVNFYTKDASNAFGLSGVNGPSLIFIRFKNMLTREKYKKIKHNFLRVHRQFVLGSEMRSQFDYCLLAVGPLEAAQFSRFSSEILPPIGIDGTIKT